MEYSNGITYKVSYIGNSHSNSVYVTLNSTLNYAPLPWPEKRRNGRNTLEVC